MKKFISVLVLFDESGKITPKQFYWEDGRIFDIDKIFKIDKSASLKVGGAGIRFFCSAHGKKINLFFEDGRWFSELS